MKESLKRITFGIRFKISGVIIVTVIFISAMIGMALYNKQINDNKEEMLRLGSTIIKGGESSARDYFNASAGIDDHGAARNRSSSVSQGLVKTKKESLSHLMKYFPSMVKRERLLDISFLIRMERGGRADWEEYIYFKRNEPGIFSKSGRDPELKSSIVDYFKNNVSVNSRLAFASGRNDDEAKFVLVGYPVLRSWKSRRIYTEYNSLGNDTLYNADELKKARASKKKFRKLFIARSVAHNPYMDYEINFGNNKYAAGIFRRILKNYSPSARGKSIKEVHEDFITRLTSEVPEFNISSSSLRKIVKKTLASNRWKIKKTRTQKDVWADIFRYFRRHRIKTVFPLTTDQLAQTSFNSDLAGIVGITLHRKTFYSGIRETEKEIVNLSLSILLRCLFIAVFFPGFIIQTVRALSVGAEKIGNGDFDYRIAEGSNDELGRLAGLFNQMAGNLKQAQIESLEKQRMEGELHTASEIQNALLPGAMPEIKDLELAAYYSSASEAGGDYYDFIRLDDRRLALVVADVSGHGVGSGLVMAMTRTMLHMLFDKGMGLKEIAGAINTYLHENTAARFFVSMFLGIYDHEEGQLKYVSCGHNPSIIVRNGKAKEIPAGGIAMGAASGTFFGNALKLRTVQLSKDDVFIGFTDGIVEMMDTEDNEYGEERFFDVIEKNSALPLQTVMDNAVADVEKFKGSAPQHDDVTMVALRVKA